MINNIIKLSIVIVAYNSQDEIGRCLTAIQNSLIKGYEIIVVDNASDDNTTDIIKQKFSSVTIIENKKNLGFGSANNVGIKKASGEYICLINPDAYVELDTLSELIAFMGKKPDIGIIGPQLLNEDGSFQNSAKRFPGIITEFCNYSIIGNSVLNMFKKLRLKIKYSRQSVKNNLKQLNEGYKADWLTGACVIIRKEAIGKIGLFDEKYFMYCEETDLFYRLSKETDFVTWFYPMVNCTHAGSHSTSKKWVDNEIRGLESRFYFFRKNYGRIHEAILKILIYLEYFAQLILFPIFYVFMPDRIADLKLRNRILFKWIMNSK